MREARTRLGLLAVAMATLVTPLAGGVAGAEPSPGDEAVAPIGAAELPDDFSTQYYNGEDSSVEEFPFVIAGLREGGPRPEGQSCTASVVAPTKILTAAHCKDASGEKSYLYGLTDLQAGGGFRTEVVSYVQHPRYVNFDQGYDVAVVTVADPIPVPNGEYAEFATSEPRYDHLDDPGQSGVGVGYGKKTHNDSPADVTLDKATLPIVDGDRRCQGVGAGFDGRYMICAGYSDGRVTIQPGDSGGPFIVDGVVVGVGSWSRSDFRWYSIYSRLNNEMGDWVASQVGDEQPPEEGELSVTVSPSALDVEPGGTISATVTTTAGDAGAEDVELSASGLPSGAEAVFQPATVTAGETAKLTITTGAGTPGGTSTVTVTGTAGSGSDTASVRLTVGEGEPEPGDISVSTSPSSGSVRQGGFARTTVSASGGEGGLTLSAEGAPAGSSVFFGPRTIENGGSSTLHVFPGFQAGPGTYPITVTATDASGATGTTTYTLTVT